MIKYIDSSKTKYIAKIADYGISRELDNGKATTILGTPRYMSPEILLGVEEYTDKSDLFSLGTMIYQLYFNSFPFVYPLKQADIQKNYSVKKKEDCEDKLLDDLLNKLLKYEPDERISWDDYFQHPFFNQKGVEDLTNKIDNLKIYDEKEHQIIHLYDYVLERMVDFNTNIIIDPIINITIDECLKLKDEPFFILGILGKYLQQIGISVTIERENLRRSPEMSEYHKNIIQSICNSYILKSKYLLHFDLGEKLQLLVRNPIERCKFNEKIRKAIMKIYNLKEEELVISNHRKENNKFTAILVVKSNYSKEITKDELIKVFSEDEELKTLERVDKELLMSKIKLSQSMLFPKEDNKKNKWAIGEKRGGEDYMPPLGWIKYGINIDHGFNERSSDWISYLHKRGEWAVAYCGIGITETLKQIYENDDDIRHRDRKVGVGVYCPSDPKLLEKYTETINANGENYKVGFMIRVRPDKIRASEKDQNMWVVNGNYNELRPYGILIKKI
jgi:serine/threonine protein kinase